MSKPALKSAFFSLGMWHIWDAFQGNSSASYETAKDHEEMFTLLYGQGYHLVAINKQDHYFFELRETDIGLPKLNLT